MALGRHVALLDPLRQLDLLVGGEQLDPADRAQVEAQRVEARLDRQVELGLLRAARLRLALRLLVGGEPVLGDHVDAVLDQVGVQALDLLLGDLDLLERLRDLLEGEIAALAARRRSAPAGPRSRAAAPRRRRSGSPPFASGPAVAVLHEKRVRLLSQSPVLSCCLRAARRSIRLGTRARRSRTLLAMATDRTHPATTPRRPGRPPRDRGQPDPGRRARRREGDPRLRQRRAGDGDRRAGDYYFAELECFVDLNPQQAGVHMSRFEEVVNEAIDERRPRASRCGRGPRRPHRRAGPRAPGGPARRGPDRRPLPGDRPDARRPASTPRRSTPCSAPRSPPSAAPAP